MVYKNNKKGAQGIGTLIIFIALILVAAVAAGVLIQTASNLQSKALNVGTQAQQRVTTALDVISVNAVNAGNGSGGSYGILNTSENLTAIVRLAPGSNPIQLSNMKIYFTTQSKQQILNFINGTTINSTDFSATGDTNGYIETGNTVTLYMHFPTNITESQNLEISLLPKDGTSNPVILTTPTVMTTKIISLR